MLDGLDGIYLRSLVLKEHRQSDANNDKSSAKYSISKSWNSLPYNLKSEQPDEFLEELKQYFNISNDEECQVEKCWLCGHD